MGSLSKENLGTMKFSPGSKNLSLEKRSAYAWVQVFLAKKKCKTKQEATFVLEVDFSSLEQEEKEDPFPFDISG